MDRHCLDCPRAEEGVVCPAPYHKPCADHRKAKLAERAAIDAMEGALCRATSLIDLPDRWGEPRHRAELSVIPKMSAGEVYGIVDAFKELNAIVNDPEFSPHNFD